MVWTPSQNGRQSLAKEDLPVDTARQEKKRKTATIFDVWEWMDGSWLYRSYIYIYFFSTSAPSLTVGGRAQRLATPRTSYIPALQVGVCNERQSYPMEKTSISEGDYSKKTEEMRENNFIFLLPILLLDQLSIFSCLNILFISYEVPTYCHYYGVPDHKIKENATDANFLINRFHIPPAMARLSRSLQKGTTR